MTSESAANKAEYTKSVIRMYISLPETPQNASKSDWIVANQLFDRSIDLETVKHALLLASARRLSRSPDMPRLSMIRSLYYFLPVIEELIEQPLPKGYSEYLEGYVAQLAARCSCTKSRPALDQISTFSRDR